MTFLEFAAPPLTKLIQTLATKSLTQALQGVRRERQMKRLIEDAVDRVVEQAEGYLRSEKLAREKQELLLTAIFTQLQPFVDEPARLFRAGLDGQRIFEQAHASGQLPEEIREEGLEQFYSVLFPHVAQLVAGSPLALQAWQAENYREGFRQLNQLAAATHRDPRCRGPSPATMAPSGRSLPVRRLLSRSRRCRF